MYKYATAVGADIGRMTIRLAVVRHDGQVMHQSSCALEKSPDKTCIIDELTKAIAGIRRLAPADGLNPVAIGISAKGFIDHEKGIILGPDQGISDWKNVPLARILSKETGLPSFIGNDANLMTVAELRDGPNDIPILNVEPHLFALTKRIRKRLRSAPDMKHALHRFAPSGIVCPCDLVHCADPSGSLSVQIHNPSPRSLRWYTSTTESVIANAIQRMMKYLSPLTALPSC